MMSREYATAEIRWVARVAELLLGDGDIPAMLRYAAGVVERCEAEIARLGYPPNGEEIDRYRMLRRILRGDAGKEER